MPLWKLGKFFYVPGRLHKVKRKNVNITLAILTSAALFILFCPLPFQVLCTLELKPRDANRVHVVVPGVLEEISVEAGQEVKTGAKLGRLSNADLSLEIADIEGRIEKAKAKKSFLQYGERELHNKLAAKELPEVEKTLAALHEQLAEKKADQKHLEFVAPVDGVVLPPPEVPKAPDRGTGELPRWSGSPLQDSNLGAFLSPPALFCQIGDPRKWEAHLAIDQDDIEFIRPQLPVAIKLDELPYETFHTTIAEIGPEMKFTPKQLSSKSGGELMSQQDETGTERPISTSFQARADLVDETGSLIEGLRGTAKISAPWQPLGKRLWRYVMRTFNFTL
jgi:putative peptide zinc metalloprotease protein